MPVGVSFNADRSRVAFRLAHPKGNILTADIVDALRSGIEALGQNPHLKLITFEGEGADFSFGASIPEHAPEQIARVLPLLDALVADVLEAPAVTAAVVRGRCLGGGFELALACDLIFAADGAQFGLPEIRLGVFPPAAAVLLPARVGQARAARDVLTGEVRPAAYWRDAGLIALTAPLDGLSRAVDEWFDEHLVPKSAVALRHAALAVRNSLLAEVRERLPTLERLYLNDLMRTHDAREGVQAFLEKRPPQWRDD
jgi:cyclohexa-1,5-dienecarbonyl-CoA hydratase